MENKFDIQEFYQKLDETFKEGDRTKALEFLEEWQKIAEDAGDPAAMVAVYNELGGVCRVTGQFDRAKDLYIKVTDLLDKMELTGTEHHATALINTGDVYISSKEWEPALEYLSQARDMLMNLGLDNDYRMAALCNNISAVYREVGNFPDAETSLFTAFQIIIQIPECRGELATTFVNLGGLQIKQNKLNEAIESFTNAVEVYESENGDKDIHYSAALAGLGEAHYLAGELDEAEKSFVKALELIERDFGKSDSYEIVSRNLEAVRKEKQKNGADPK